MTFCPQSYKKQTADRNPCLLTNKKTFNLCQMLWLRWFILCYILTILPEMIIIVRQIKMRNLGNNVENVSWTYKSYISPSWIRFITLGFENRTPQPIPFFLTNLRGIAWLKELCSQSKLCHNLFSILITQSNGCGVHWTWRHTMQMITVMYSTILLHWGIRIDEIRIQKLTPKKSRT